MAFASGHALLIGVGSYPKLAQHWQAPITAEDAKALATVLQDPAVAGYLEAQVTLLHDKTATREHVLRAFDALAEQTGEHDTVFFFYSGHGHYGTDNAYYLTTHDTEVEQIGMKAKVRAGSGISQEDLLAKLRNIKAKKVLLIFNACHAGELMPTLGPDEEPVPGENLSDQVTRAVLGTGEGRILISACRPTQYSFIGPGTTTIFAQVLVAGLQGTGVPSRGGYISAFDLYSYMYDAVGSAVREKVPEHIRNAYGGIQEPTLTIIQQVGSFPIALYKGQKAIPGAFTASAEPPKGIATTEVDWTEARSLFQQLVQVYAERDVIQARGDIVYGDKVSGDKVGGDKIVFEADTAHQVPAGITSPYRDLDAFRIEDARSFFGREALIEEGWRKWCASGRRFLALVGASGTGKSSLAQAGIMPRILDDSRQRGETPLYCILRPGDAPLRALADELRQQHISLHDNFASLLHEAPTLLTTVLANLPTQPVVLVIDQLEELFTLTVDPAERIAFINALLHASTTDTGNTGILLTLRADFYGACASFPQLRKHITEHQVMVGIMTPDELERAIIEPVAQAAMAGRPTFAGGLVRQIIADAGKSEGTLPLLQYCLGRLWRTGELTLAAYRSFGGVQGAIQSQAEQTYASLSPKDKRAMRRLLLLLFLPGERGEDTRRRVLFTELIPSDDNNGQLEQLVQRLVGARLLTIDDSAQGRLVEVSHEALIRSWPRLQFWIDENRESIRTHRQLTEAAKAWDRSERDASYLYHGIRLAAAQEWIRGHEGELNALEQDFVHASIAARESAARQRRRAARQRLMLQSLAGGLALIIIIAVGLLWWQSDRVTRWLSPWQPVAHNFCQDAFFTLLATYQSPPTYYAGTLHTGICRSTDLATWEVLSAGLPTTGTDNTGIVRVHTIMALAVDPTAPQLMLASLLGQGIYRSADGGQHWQPVHSGLETMLGNSSNAVELTIHSSLALAVFYPEGALFASVDGGQSWQRVRVSATASDYVYTGLLANSSGDRAYVGTDKGLYIGTPPTNGQKIWQWERTAQISAEVLHIARDTASTDQNLYLETYNGQYAICRWRPGEPQQPVITFSEKEGNPVKMMAPRGNVVYALLSNGEVWSIAAGREPLHLGQPVGRSYHLLAIERQTGSGTKLLLGHDNGLFEYRPALNP